MYLICGLYVSSYHGTFIASVTWINPIISFSAYLGIFMALLIGFQKSGSSRRNSYFALIIGLLSLQILKSVATDALGFKLNPAIYLAIQGSCLFIGPAVYLYVRNMLPRDSDCLLKPWRHFLLGTIYILAIVTMAVVLQRSPGITSSVTPAFTIPFGYTIIFGQIYHVLWYFHRALTRLKWYHNEENADPMVRRLRWMTISVWTMAGIIVLLIIPFLFIAAFGELGLIGYLNQGFLLAVSILINYSAIQSFNQPEIVLTISKPSIHLTESKAAEWQRLDQELQLLMLEKKPHLAGDLRINDMAEMLQVSTTDLSNFVNQHLQVNFTEFINDYRVKEAERLLVIDEEDHLSILEIALEAGFNSKPTFNRVFKEKTGLTPSEYRRQRCNSTTDRATS